MVVTAFGVGVCDDGLWVIQEGKKREKCIALKRLSLNPHVFASETCLCLLFSIWFSQMQVFRAILLSKARTSNKYRQVESWTTAALLAKGRYHRGRDGIVFFSSSSLSHAGYWQRNNFPVLLLTFTGWGQPIGPTTHHSQTQGPSPSWKRPPPFHALLMDVSNTQLS